MRYTHRFTRILPAICCLLLLTAAFPSVDLTSVPDDTSRPLLDVMAATAGSQTAWVGYHLEVRPSMARMSIRSVRNEKHRYVHVNSWSGNDDLPGIEYAHSTQKLLMVRYENGRPAGLLVTDAEKELNFTGTAYRIENVSSSRSLDAMKTLATGGNEDIRYAFMAALAAHPDDEVSAWLLARVRSGADEDERKSALFWYGKTLPENELGALPDLEEELSGEEMLKAVAFAYHDKDTPEALDRLVHMATTAGHEVAKTAIFWIGQSNHADNLAVLKQLYGKLESTKLREQVIFAASQIETEESMAFLYTVATTDADIELQKKAVFWIGNSDTENALEILKKVYDKATSPETRERLVFAISRVETDEALAMLKDIALSDESSAIREKAIFWIGNSGENGKALEMLKQLYSRESSSEVRDKIIFSISRVDSSQALELLINIARSDELMELRKKAIFWIAQHDDESLALRHLTSLYSEGGLGLEEREQIIFAAHQVDSEEATRFLLNVAKTEENRELRKKAIFWLSRSDSRAADEYFDTVLSGSGEK